MKTSEVELAKHVVAYFKANSYEVYEEVSYGNAHALDLAAVRGHLIAAIECKTSLSLVVLGQAKNWIGKANLVYVAVPYHKQESSHQAAKWICNLLGLGLLYVSKHGNIQEIVHPNFNRVNTKPLFDKLHDLQKNGTVPAGSTSGGRYTPFKISVMNLVEIVQKNPGIKLKEALKKMKHHWSNDTSARACIVKYIENGTIKELRFEGKDRKLFSN